MTSDIVGLVAIAVGYFAGRWFLSLLLKNKTSTGIFKLAVFALCGAGFGVVIAGGLKAFWFIPYNVQFSSTVQLLILILSVAIGGILGALIAVKTKSTIAPLSPATQEAFAKAAQTPTKILKRNQGIAMVGTSVLLGVLDYFQILQSIQDQWPGGIITLRVIYIFVFLEGVYLLTTYFLQKR